MHRVRGRMVEFAVNDTLSCCHPLEIAGRDYRMGAEAVAMLQRTLQHVGDDLHVAMAVGGKPAAARNAIVIDHAQNGKAVLLGVVIFGEREGVPAVEPRRPGHPAVRSFSERDHDLSPWYRRAGITAAPGLIVESLSE